jgi:hypothetical protein
MNRAALDAAFRATSYRVVTPEGIFALRIGVADAAFDAFLYREVTLGQSLGSTGRAIHWGIVTAYNPGVLLSTEENQLRQQRLHDRIAAAGWRFLKGCNLADDDLWPAEPSCFLLHVDEGQLRILGREFDQLAVVCGRTGTAPRLLWI